MTEDLLVLPDQVGAIRRRICETANLAVGSRYARGHGVFPTFDEQGKLMKPGLFDCLQLVWRVGERAGVLTVDPAQAEEFLPYDDRPDGETLVRALNTFLVRLGRNQWGRGDVALFTLPQRARMMTSLPQHLGIIVSANILVHAERTHGVVPTPIGGGLQVTRCWRYPGLAEAVA